MAADKETSWLIKIIDKITGPLKKIDEVVRKSTGGLDRLAKKNENVQSSFSGIGKALAGIGLAASMTMLTQESMAFEKGMALVNTVMKQTPQELALVADQVRDLSTEIPLMRDQFTSGLNDVVQAGVPAQNAMQFLADSARAAVGGQADLSEVVKTTVSIVKAYGMEWDKSLEIQNRMQKAVDIGMMSMGEFASALPKVTVLASTLGVGIDEMTGAFAAMTGVTGNASEVSTQLSAIMAGLISPTSQAAEMAERLGIAFDAKSIQGAGGLGNYLNTLMPKIDALSAKTGMTKEGIIAQLFGRKEAIVGVLALTGQLKDSWSEATNEMMNSTGAVQFAFDQMNNTTEAKITKMKNSLFSLWDQIFNAIQPILQALIDGISMFINGIVDFKKSYPVFSRVVFYIAVMSGSLMVLETVAGLAAFAYGAFTTALNGGSLIKVIGFIISIGASLLGLQAPMWAATSSTWALNAALWANPIGLIVLAILALIAVVTIMIMKWEDWGAALAIAFGPLGMIISFVMSLRKNWEMVKKSFAEGGILEGLKAIGKVFLDAVLYPVQQLISIIADFTGAQWAKNAVAGIENFRKGLGLNTDKAQPEAKKDEKSMMEEIAQSIMPEVTMPEMPKVDFPGTSNSGLNAEGSTGKSGAIVNMKNTFNIQIDNAKKSSKEIAEEVLTYITDGLADAALITN